MPDPTGTTSAHASRFPSKKIKLHTNKPALAWLWLPNSEKTSPYIKIPLWRPGRVPCILPPSQSRPAVFARARAERASCGHIKLGSGSQVSRVITASVTKMRMFIFQMQTHEEISCFTPQKRGKTPQLPQTLTLFWQTTE